MPYSVLVFILNSVTYVLLCAFFFWRMRVNLRRGYDIRRQISWLTFLTAYELLVIIFLLFPGIARQAAAVLLVLFFGAAIVANLYLCRRYDQWFEEQEEKRKNEEQ